MISTVTATIVVALIVAFFKHVKFPKLTRKQTDFFLLTIILGVFIVAGLIIICSTVIHAIGRGG